jgi:hypothetical protein
MRAVTNMLEQDLKLLLRNALFWVMAATLVFIILTVRFLIPEDFSATPSALATYGFGGGVPGATMLEDPAAVESLVRETGAVGAVRQGDELTILHSDLSDQAAAALATRLTPPVTTPPAVETEVLRPQGGVVPQNLRVTPVAITFEAIVLGFLMASVLMLSERQEGVLEAYRISPGSALTYVASKTLLFMGLGTLYAVAMAVTTVGVAFSWPAFLLLSLLAGALYTMFGLGLTVFFRDISGWFVVAMLVLGINMVPVISHAAPTFAPAWLVAIPSYAIVFAFDEVLFPTGKSLAGTYLTLGAWTVAALVACTALIDRRLLSAR